MTSYLNSGLYKPNVVDLHSESLPESRIIPGLTMSVSLTALGLAHAQDLGHRLRGYVSIAATDVQLYHHASLCL